MAYRFREFTVLLLAASILLCSISAVRSEPEFLSSDESRDLCGGTLRASACPINCFRADPVCGANGVTYWCGCPDAACAGVKVVKLGYCEVGNGGSGSLSGQALLLVHIVWLIVLGFSVLFGLF